jgi:NAD(P)-dependent dehydrogenase (short-subunit alcohol dehydrogenase family)
LDIQGKVAVVTGGASGIGRATAIALATEGADLVLADINDAGMEEACAEIAGLGRKAIAVHTDVSKLEDVQRLFDRSVSEMGRVDILMNNAGVHIMGPTEKIPIADWEWIVGINLWSVIYGVNVFLHHMMERGSGHIVNTASMAGLIAGEPSTPYVTTKFAVVGLSEGLAVYLRPKGIGVSVLCPGWVKTGIGQHERLVPFDDGFDDVRAAIFEEVGRGDWSRLEGLPTGVMSAEEVAGKVVHAIKDNTFLIYTRDEQKGIVMQKAANPEETIDALVQFHAVWENLFKGGLQ